MLWCGLCLIVTWCLLFSGYLYVNCVFTCGFILFWDLGVDCLFDCFLGGYLDCVRWTSWV